jgi:hypothetical protein
MSTGVCIQNTNWGIDSQNPFQGWMECSYTYNWTGFDLTKYNQLSNWCSSLYSGLSQTNPVDALRIVDSNLIYASILDFYNQIYFQKNYYINSNSIQKTPSFFINMNILTPSNLNSIINNIDIQVVKPSLETKIDINFLLDACKFPEISSDGKTVSLYLSHDLFKQYLQGNSQPERDQQFSNFITSFLRDTQAVMHKYNQELVVTDCIISDSSPTFFSYIQLVDSSGKNVPNYGILETDIKNISLFYPENPEYTNCIFGYVKVTATIQNWSPMLYMYAISNNFLPSDIFKNTVLMEKISSDIQTIPSGYYEYLTNCCYPTMQPDCCSDTVIKDIKNKIQNYCLIRYENPSILPEDVQSYLLVQDNADCTCYTSALVPASYDPQFGNETAMCFDTHCKNNLMSSIFNLSDETCKKDCDTISDWVYNDNQNGLPNPSELNTDRLKNLCGTSYNPYVPTKQNLSKTILILGTVSTVLFGALVFSLCKHKNFGMATTTILVVLTLSIFIGTTVFFSKDLVGIEFCDGNKFICKSKYTKLNIPTQFCANKLICECNFDNDCSSSCTCKSSQCIPKEGTRKTTTVQVRDPNVLLIILSTILLIIVPIILIYLHDDYHWKVGKKIFVPIVIVCALIPYIIILVSTFKKQSRTIYTGSCGDCSQIDCGLGKKCVDNECVCDDTCISGTCNYFNSCGDLCECPEGQSCVATGNNQGVCMLGYMVRGVVNSAPVNVNNAWTYSCSFQTDFVLETGNSIQFLSSNEVPGKFKILLVEGNFIQIINQGNNTDCILTSNVPIPANGQVGITIVYYKGLITANYSDINNKITNISFSPSNYIYLMDNMTTYTFEQDPLNNRVYIGNVNIENNNCSPVCLNQLPGTKDQCGGVCPYKNIATESWKYSAVVTVNTLPSVSQHYILLYDYINNVVVYIDENSKLHVSIFYPSENVSNLDSVCTSFTFQKGIKNNILLSFSKNNGNTTFTLNGSPFTESLVLPSDLTFYPGIYNSSLVNIIDTNICIPNCENVVCGPDGCGGICNTGPYNGCFDIKDTCVSGACVSCYNCQDKPCGSPGCAPNCGICPTGPNGIQGQCVGNTCQIPNFCNSSDPNESNVLNFFTGGGGASQFSLCKDCSSNPTSQYNFGCKNCVLTDYSYSPNSVIPTKGTLICECSDSSGSSACGTSYNLVKVPFDSTTKYINIDETSYNITPETVPSRDTQTTCVYDGDCLRLGVGTSCMNGVNGVKYCV